MDPSDWPWNAAEPKSSMGVFNCAALLPSPFPIFPWQEAQCCPHKAFPAATDSEFDFTGLAFFASLSGTAHGLGCKVTKLVTHTTSIIKIALVLNCIKDMFELRKKVEDSKLSEDMDGE